MSKSIREAVGHDRHCLINAVTGDVESARFSLSGNPTYQELAQSGLRTLLATIVCNFVAVGSTAESEPIR